ncbi:hypothetical protein SAMN05192562_102340 [Kosakonia arachidis]|uniref:Uncharacterized protein n=1 Tax=Kosakonia arachidis TaxID=551989 RepID=A0A1I7B6Z5_9ENTR|nr:hypothetical protein [Kosakonia arachidis]SFT82894.1 hypothetical protein SAMN05192562_102340 [Kosakonia arachidis]
MDPITSPDPTPLWREGNYPFVWSLIAPGGVTPIAPTFDKWTTKKNPGRLAAYLKNHPLLVASAEGKQNASNSK